MSIIVEWSKPYTWWDGIGIDTNKVISVLLRAENNLIKLNGDNELYTDLQLADWIEPEDDFPVWITVGKILEEDWRDQNGLLLNWKTTSWDYARWIYWADWEIYFDWGTWEWKQVYYSEEVDGLFTALRNELANVAFTWDYNDLINRPEIPVVYDWGLTVKKNGTTIGTFTANQQTDEIIDITVPTKTSDLDNDSWFIDNTVDDLVNYTKTSDLAAVALSNDYDDLDDKPTIWDAVITIQKNGNRVNDFNVNATSNKTINITLDKTDVWLWNVDNTSDLDKPISTATQSALDLKANSADLATVATTGSYTDLINKPTIWDGTITIQKNWTAVDTFTTNQTTAKSINITMTKSDVGLSNVDNTSDLAKPISTATQTALDWKQATISDLATIRSNATDGKSAYDTIQTYWDIVTHDANEFATAAQWALADTAVQPWDLATVATTWDYDDLLDKPTIPTVINNVTSTDTANALSAAQGKVLQDQIDDLKSLGKFLSLWDASTWLPISFPEDVPYTYSTWDYFLVETVWATNYRPNWASYTGTASTTVETDELEVWDLYIYDWQVWLLQINHGKTVSFANLAWSPSDNAALDAALDAKADISSLATVATSGSYADLSNKPTIWNATITIQKNWTSVDTFTTNANTAKSINITMTKSDVWLGNVDNTSDANKPISTATQAALNLKANSADLATVATSWDYDDLLDKPNLATVATSWSYNDLIDKPSIPGWQVQSDWTQTDSNEVDYIKNKPSLATVATSWSYNDLSNKPTIPAAQVQTDWNATSGMASIKNRPTLATVATTWAYSDLSWTPTLATVATSGSYSDLTNKPTIPAAQVNSDWDATSGVAKILNKPTIPSKTSDLTNDSWYITSSSVPTKTSELTNDSWFITSAYHDSSKQDKLDTQTAYTAKGTGQKVPQITTNTLWQVTNLSETNITFPVTSVNGSTWAVTVSEFSPSWTATTGYVVTKTASGYEWQAPSGWDVVVSSQANNILTSWMKIWAWTEANYANLWTYDNNTLYLTV